MSLPTTIKNPKMNLMIWLSFPNRRLSNVEVAGWWRLSESAIDPQNVLARCHQLAGFFNQQLWYESHASLGVRRMQSRWNPHAVVPLASTPFQRKSVQFMLESWRLTVWNVAGSFLVAQAFAHPNSQQELLISHSHPRRPPRRKLKPRRSVLKSRKERMSLALLTFSPHSTTRLLYVYNDPTNSN